MYVGELCVNTAKKLESRMKMTDKAKKQDKPAKKQQKASGSPLLDRYLQKQNTLEDALKRSNDEVIAKAIQDLLKKDTLH